MGVRARETKCQHHQRMLIATLCSMHFIDASQCAPFDFSLEIDFVDDEEDIFSCNLPLIPTSLDSPQYTENEGFIHFTDSFVLDDRTMSFTVGPQSFLRVSIRGKDILSFMVFFIYYYL